MKSLQRLLFSNKFDLTLERSSHVFFKGRQAEDRVRAS